MKATVCPTSGKAGSAFKRRGGAKCDSHYLFASRSRNSLQHSLKPAIKTTLSSAAEKFIKPHCKHNKTLPHLASEVEVTTAICPQERQMWRERLKQLLQSPREHLRQRCEQRLLRKFSSPTNQIKVSIYKVKEFNGIICGDRVSALHSLKQTAHNPEFSGVRQRSAKQTSTSALHSRAQFTESQNSRGWQGPLWVTQPYPLPKQGHPEQAAQHCVQAGLEYLQRRRLHSLPGQPGPGLHHPQREEVLPLVQLELPVLQFVPVAPCPVAGHH